MQHVSFIGLLLFPLLPPIVNPTDDVALQDDVLHFISTVLIFDHPRLCKHLRTNILAIKVQTDRQTDRHA